MTLQETARRERRMELRQRVIKGAVLRFNRGYGSFEGRVRNISGSGARISFGETSAIPSAFDVVISGDAARPARICWRTKTEIGLSFA